MLRYLHSFPTRRSSDLATYINIEPTIIAVVVAVAASASFSTPIGYQTNLIVYGPGGYTFKDYFKVGLPLNLLFMLTTIFSVYLFAYNNTSSNFLVHCSCYFYFSFIYLFYMSD